MSFQVDLELNFAECIINGEKATLGVRQRMEMDPLLRTKQNEFILQAICALLNSGGGVIVVEIENEDYNHEGDGLGLDLPAMFRNHLDDMQQGNRFLIFVNSWNAEVSGVRLATLCSNLYLRHGTSTGIMDSLDALRFLQRRVRVLRKDDYPNSLSPREAQAEGNMRALADDLFDRGKLQYLEKLNFSESLHVVFQMFSADLTQGIKESLPKYVSALANTEGGYVFFGVHDETHQVIGCEKEKVNLHTLRVSIDCCIRKMPVHHFCAQNYRVQYVLKFLEVYDKGVLRGYVCAIKVEQFCCAAFAKAPSSWEMKENQMKLATKDWAAWMMETDPELSRCPQMVLARSMLKGTPRSRTVCTLTNLKRLEELQKDYFPVSPGRIVYTPESVYKELFLRHKGLRDLISTETRPFSQGILIFSHSWAVDLGLQRKQGVICDALLISQNNSPILYTVCNKWDLGYWNYSKRVAYSLKERLVNTGGYTGRLGIIPLVFQLNSDKSVKAIHSSEIQVYPESYNFTTMEQMEALLQSLVIVLFGFRSFLNEELYSDNLTLLTDQQYELLSKNLHKTRELFVHGLPGSGKTILALGVMEKIRNVFDCQSNDILYICENVPLKKFVRRGFCQAVTRKVFLKNTFENIQHIVVDEAQNFRTEDGDWYAKAKSITQRRRDGPGILCIFLDYFQINHLCCSGLPDLQHQEPIIKLTRMLHNGEEIANYLQGVMQVIRENPPPNVPSKALMIGQELRWVQGISGNLEITEHSDLDKLAICVAEKCRFLWVCGYYPKDVAVLFSKANDIEKYKDKFQLAMRRRSTSQCDGESYLLVHIGDALDAVANEIVLDTVNRFSGLERSIVFGVIPREPETAIFYSVLLCLASRAKTHLFILKVSL
uniref:Schlafen 5 n=1 Tax=Nannospalax galili TaxID=1026970 RepID=A0A8C6R2Y2_NANGA